MSLELTRRVPTMARALADEDPAVIACRIGWGRVVIGLSMLTAPHVLTRPFLRGDEASPDAVTAWRMAGARDVALGLGTLLAARRGSPALRGWAEASALADFGDVYAFGRDEAFSPVLRAGAVLSAAVAGGVGMWAARRLGDERPSRASAHHRRAPE